MFIRGLELNLTNNYRGKDKIPVATGMTLDRCHSLGRGKLLMQLK